MQYFQMKEDINYTNRPIVQKWMKLFSLQDLYEGNYQKIPKRIILEIRPNPNTEFIDVIYVPFLMISQKIKEVIELYEPNVEYKEIILLDKKNGLVGEYYLPLLSTIDALHEDSVFTNFHTILKKMVLRTDNVGDKSVFWVKDISKEVTVWRYDIIETILLHGAYGFIIEELEFSDCKKKRN